MRQYLLTEQLRKIIRDSKLNDILLDESICGVIAAEAGSNDIIYMNPIAVDLLMTDRENGKRVRLDDFFDSDEMDHIGNDRSFFFEPPQKKIEVFPKGSDKYILLLLNDVTRLAESEEERNTLRMLNKSLQTVYEQYNDDTICIADNHGKIEFAGEACYRHCGITAEDIISMNIFDLERERIFYPAVTTKVLVSGKTEVVMSDTKIGVMLITIGVPIFDEQGNIKKVISISRDFSKELEIATLLAQVKNDIYEEGEKEEFDQAIVTCSNKIYGLMTLMRMVAKTDTTVMLEGETGTGKGVFARYIHSKSNRDRKPFVIVNCGAIAENLIESELFGYEAGYIHRWCQRREDGPLLKWQKGGTLFLDEISELPLSQQVKLLSVLQDKIMLRVGGRKYIDLNFRLIVATNHDLEEMMKQGAISGRSILSPECCLYQNPVR